MAAFRKRNVCVSDHTVLYENEDLDAPISIGGKLLHTKNMKFLYKAAVATEEDNLKAPNKWKLSTVHRVEELKSLIRMGPITLLQLLNLVYYLICAKFYTLKPIQVHEAGRERVGDDGFELTGHV